MKVLLVDDNQQIVSFLKNALKAECFAVDCASDGKEGSYLARTNEYDVIILDLNLPEKDGLSVCREIREDGCHVPIIILSIKEDIPTKVELLEAGADDYLTKPFSFDELKARIKALVRRPKSIEKEIINFDGYSIDLSKNEVTHNGKQISLTRKEYELLSYLAKNMNRVVSRGTLVEHVWDMNADPFSNSLEVHVRNIRKKLGLSPKDSFIKTVSGRGYMLEVEENN